MRLEPQTCFPWKNTVTTQPVMVHGKHSTVHKPCPLQNHMLAEEKPRNQPFLCTDIAQWKFSSTNPFWRKEATPQIQAPLAASPPVARNCIITNQEPDSQHLSKCLQLSYINLFSYQSHTHTWLWLPWHSTFFQTPHPTACLIPSHQHWPVPEWDMQSTPVLQCIPPAPWLSFCKVDEV